MSNSASGTSRLGFADRLANLLLNLQQRLNRLMAGEQRFENFILGHDLSAAFDHDNGVAAAGKKDIGIAFAKLGFASDSLPTCHPCGQCAPQRAGR